MNYLNHSAPIALLGLALFGVGACGQPSEQSTQAAASEATEFPDREFDPWAEPVGEEPQEESPQEETGERVYFPSPEEREAANEGQPEAGGQSNNEEANPTEEGGDSNGGAPEEGQEENPQEPEPQPEPVEEEPEPPRTGVYGDYDFDDADSLLYVQVFKDESAFASGFAHNHAIRASNWEGQFSYPNGRAEDCALTVSLPVNELIVDEPQMRRRVGYDDELSQSQRNEIRGHMLAENQLNGDRFPTINFTATSCTGGEGASGRISVRGNMEIRGQSSPVTISLQYRIIEDSLYLRGELPITHAQFGFRPYRAFGGAVRNQERLVIGFDLQSNTRN